MTDSEHLQPQPGEASRETPAEVNDVPYMKIHWSLMILLGAIALTGCAGLLSTAVANGAEATGNIVWVFGLLLILPMLVAAGVFRVSGRSNRAANLAFAITALATIIPQSITAILHSNQRIAGIKSAAAEMNQISREARSLDLDSTKIEELGDRSVAALEKLKDGLSGSTKTMAAYLQKQTEQSFKLRADYIKVIEGLVAVGGVDKINTSSVDDVISRLAMIDSALPKHDLLMAHVSTFEQRAQDEMSRAGCSQAEKQAILAGINRSISLQDSIQVTRLERQMLVAIRRQLEILRDNFGHWDYGERGNVVTQAGFPAEALAEYNKAAADVTTWSQEQAALREKFTGTIPKK